MTVFGIVRSAEDGVALHPQLYHTDKEARLAAWLLALEEKGEMDDAEFDADTPLSFDVLTRDHMTLHTSTMIVDHETGEVIVTYLMAPTELPAPA